MHITQTIHLSPHKTLCAFQSVTGKLVSGPWRLIKHNSCSKKWDHTVYESDVKWTVDLRSHWS